MNRLITFFLIFFPFTANAFTGRVEINGIFYNIITKAQVAEVTHGDRPYSLSVINIPSIVEYDGVVCNVKTIGEEAFKDCKELSSVSVPNSVTSLGRMAFFGCENMVSILGIDKVTSIGSYAFTNCLKLSSFRIPENITSIEAGTFQNCKNIVSIIIPDKVKTIGQSAFRFCESLSSITIGYGVEKIEGSAFRSCNALTSVVIPDNVTEIEGSVFRDCTNLESVIIGNGISYIKGAAFFQCVKLKDVFIGNNVKTIGSNAFGSCSSLVSITIPNNVTTLEVSAFLNCEKLTNVIIGSGCNNIQANAFARCPELKDVYCYAKVKPNTDAMAFEDSYSNYMVIHVPSALISAYKGSTPWSGFLDVVALPLVKYIVDGGLYMQDLVIIGTPITPIPDPQKEGHTFSGWSEIPETMPKEDVTVSGIFTVNSYVLTYIVDGEVYKTEEVKYGSAITPEPEPSKTGYTFSGWSEIPANMPARDVTVNGSFTINKYKLKYIVDGGEYKTVEVEYASAITPEIAPTKEGHTFSGWSEIPERMPANDVTVTGTFTVNSYTLTFGVDGEVYKTYEINYGSKITPEEAPTKEGYTFSGWSEFPSTMPAKDLTISGSFTINNYKLIYLVDGSEYKTVEVEYNSIITPEAAPTKEGHTFSGWSEIPEKMPANDVTVTGTFTINKYQVTYIIEGEIYATDNIEYASIITPPSVQDKEGYTFAWNEYPETMPANDITIAGSFTINSYLLSYYVDGVEYKTIELEYNSSITPEEEPTKEGHTFSGWSEIPKTMPANDITITGSFIVNTYTLTYKVDGEVYKTYYVAYGTAITPETEPEKEGNTFSGWNEMPETMPANNVAVTGTFSINTYQVTYMIGGEVFKTDSVQYGAAVVVPDATEREDYTFGGWADVPETMPAHDIVIYGSYTSGIIDVSINEKDVLIYDVKGRRIPKLQRGVNIIRTREGRMRKVMVK